MLCSCLLLWYMLVRRCQFVEPFTHWRTFWFFPHFGSLAINKYGCCENLVLGFFFCVCVGSCLHFYWAKYKNANAGLPDRYRFNFIRNASMFPRMAVSFSISTRNIWVSFSASSPTLVFSPLWWVCSDSPCGFIFLMASDVDHLSCMCLLTECLFQWNVH